VETAQQRVEQIGSAAGAKLAKLQTAIHEQLNKAASEQEARLSRFARQQVG
jgi:hypothetical protein